MPEGTPTYELARWSVMIGALLIASVTDIRERRVPNWLTFPLFITGLVTALLLGGAGLDGLGGAFLGCLVMGAPYVFVYLRGGGGAGDAKLMLGIGAWSGIDLGFLLAIGVMVVGIVWTFIYAAFHGGVRPMMYSILVEVAAIARGRKITTETVGPDRNPGGQDGSSDQAVRRDGVAYAPIALAGVTAGGLLWLLL